MGPSLESTGLSSPFVHSFKDSRTEVDQISSSIQDESKTLPVTSSLPASLFAHMVDKEGSGVSSNAHEFQSGVPPSIPEVISYIKECIPPQYGDHANSLSTQSLITGLVNGMVTRYEDLVKANESMVEEIRSLEEYEALLREELDEAKKLLDEVEEKLEERVMREKAENEYRAILLENDAAKSELMVARKEFERLSSQLEMLKRLREEIEQRATGEAQNGYSRMELVDSYHNGNEDEKAGNLRQSIQSGETNSPGNMTTLVPPIAEDLELIAEEMR